MYYGLTGHFVPRKLMLLLPTLLYNVRETIEFDCIRLTNHTEGIRSVSGRDHRRQMWGVSGVWEDLKWQLSDFASGDSVVVPIKEDNICSRT